MSPTEYQDEAGNIIPKPALCDLPYPKNPKVRCEFSKDHDGACEYNAVRNAPSFRRPFVTVYRWPKQANIRQGAAPTINGPTDQQAARTG